MRCVLQQRKVFGAVRTLIYYNLVAVIRRILDCNKGCTRRPAEIRIKTVGKFPMIRMADDEDAMTAVVVVVATAAAKKRRVTLERFLLPSELQKKENDEEDDATDKFPITLAMRKSTAVGAGGGVVQRCHAVFPAQELEQEEEEQQKQQQQATPIIMAVPASLTMLLHKPTNFGDQGRALHPHVPFDEMKEHMGAPCEDNESIIKVVRYGRVYRRKNPDSLGLSVRTNGPPGFY
jgi:hypothetical protein